MALEVVMLSEISQTQTNAFYFLPYIEFRFKCVCLSGPSLLESNYLALYPMQHGLIM